MAPGWSDLKNELRSEFLAMTEKFSDRTLDRVQQMVEVRVRPLERTVEEHGSMIESHSAAVAALQSQVSELRVVAEANASRIDELAVALGRRHRRLQMSVGRFLSRSRRFHRRRFFQRRLRWTTPVPQILRCCGSGRRHRCVATQHRRSWGCWQLQRALRTINGS